MRAYININQKAFSELATLKNIKLDLVDATIFEYIFKFAVSNKATKQIIDNKLFIWCSYQKIIDDNPLLNINSKKAIELRLNKLIDIGLFEKFTDKKEGNKTYFNVTDLAYALVIENTNLSNENYQPLSNENYQPLSNENYQPLSNQNYYNSKLNNSKLNNNIELPSCIQKTTWEEWVTFRKQAKKSLTDLTIKKQIKFLEDCFNKGQNPNLIIEQSIANGWIGLFELRQNNKQSYINRCINENARTYEAPADPNKPF